MSLLFFNTMSGQKEPLKPMHEKKIKMYCCGVTPYGSTHIGHCRTFFSYDLLQRTLVDNGYSVQWARNITDVDDKIIHRANEQGISCEELVSCYINEQNETLNIFNLNKPQHEPKVTENIPEIISIIEKLIEKDYAYQSVSGVYYRVRKFNEYGKLSKNKIDDLKIGARIEVDESKEDALDFALWKIAKPNEIFWNSPWGAGRPGWHIECSAMVHSLFGDSIDIHMGGRDLIFPHHEAEIAQSQAATGKSFANLWLHAGMVTLYGEKMSKSTNHFISIKDFLAKYPSEVLRLIFLSTSYTHPLDFTLELATENLKKLSRIYRFISLVDKYSFESENSSKGNEKKYFEEDIFVDLKNLKKNMRICLADDLNSNSALALFFEFIRNANVGISKLEKQGKIISLQDKMTLKKEWPEFKTWMNVSMGLLSCEPSQFFNNLRMLNTASEISVKEIEEKINERDLARKNKNWEQSDLLRDELLKHGVQIQDTPYGTKWIVLI